MKRKIKGGTTSLAVKIFIQDTTSTTGAGLTGLVYTSAGLSAYYIRNGSSSPTAISPVSATVGTWTSGGFKEVDSANLPGLYELGIPDAALAAGAVGVVLMLKGATNMAPVLLEIELDAVDYQDAAAFGLSRMDAAVSSRSTYAGEAVASVTGNVSGSVASVTADVGITQTGADKVWGTTSRKLSSDGVQAIWDALTSVLTTVGSVGRRLADNLDAAISSRNATAPDNAGVAAILTRTDVATSTRLATSGYTAPDNSSIAAIKAKTDNLPSDPASVTNQTIINTNVLTRSSHTAADVWAAGTRTLTGFGSLVSDLAAAVWAAGSRTLTALGFSPGATIQVVSPIAGSGDITLIIGDDYGPTPTSQQRITWTLPAGQYPDYTGGGGQVVSPAFAGGAAAATLVSTGPGAQVVALDLPAAVTSLLTEMAYPYALELTTAAPNGKRQTVRRGLLTVQRPAP